MLRTPVPLEMCYNALVLWLVELARTKLEKENELEENLQNYPIERKTLKQLIIHVYVDRYF